MLIFTIIPFFQAFTINWQAFLARRRQSEDRPYERDGTDGDRLVNVGVPDTTDPGAFSEPDLKLMRTRRK